MLTLRRRVSNLDWTNWCDDVTWSYVLRKLDNDTYAVEHAGEVSLVNDETLKEMLRQNLGGGVSELGGGHVG